MGSQLIYLDNAAATPVDDAVLAAMHPFYQQQFYNPSATYSVARQVQAQLELARSQVAHWLGARSSEITFTAGGTEANNLAIHGIMQRFPEANCVVSSVEHESVLGPAHEYQVQETGVQADGRLDLEYLKKLINDQTVLLSIQYANNEIGTVQPLREVTKMVAELRKIRSQAANSLPLYIHTDACQAAQYLDLHVARLGVDLLTLNGGKIYGPKQSAALYIKSGIVLQPQISGGGQERGLRSGTENVAQAIGLSVALAQTQTIRQAESRRLVGLQQQFVEKLQRLVPQATVNGSLKFRLPNNVHITIPKVDNERLLIELDEQGIIAAAGSACSASDDEPSHVLRAIGLSDEQARSSLRFSMGRATTEAQIDQVVRSLAKLTSR